jgi:hypothetical protein
MPSCFVLIMLVPLCSIVGLLLFVGALTLYVFVVLPPFGAWGFVLVVRILGAPTFSAWVFCPFLCRWWGVYCVGVACVASLILVVWARERAWGHVIVVHVPLCGIRGVLLFICSWATCIFVWVPTFSAWGLMIVLVVFEAPTFSAWVLSLVFGLV